MSVTAAAPKVDGRTRLLDTAEEMLDQHGIDGVSVRTLTKASGHRNASAVSYHFGTREQLIEAVLQRRQEVVEQRRLRIIDELEADPASVPEDYVRAGLQPMSDLLDSKEGRRYLRLLFQAANRPEYHTRSALQYSPSLARLAPHLLPLVDHLPLELQANRLRLGLELVLTAVAGQARLIDTVPPPRRVLDRDTFIRELLTTVLGALRA